MSRTSEAAVGAVVAAAALAGCTSTAPQPSAPGEPGPITVKAADTACDVSASTAPAGKISFSINNSGTKTTEFYLYGVGDRIMGEVENIGPGLTRQLIVEVPDGGTYTTACKPGMVGDGIRAAFTVTGQAARSTDENAKLAEATAGWKRYVQSQVDALVPKTQEFADAVKKNDVAGAKTLFPVARTYYERVEPVAESFGDLDPKLDGREDDERDPGAAWTGFHRLEKDLWVTGLQPDSGKIADQLVADTKDLQSRVPTLTFTPVELANGAKELLDEVATGKITGEEDRYSHTDLSDFAANVEGAHKAFVLLRPALVANGDKGLAETIDARFAAVAKGLDKYRRSNPLGYAVYSELTPADRRALSHAVDGLAEPLSTVAGKVAG